MAFMLPVAGAAGAAGGAAGGLGSIIGLAGSIFSAMGAKAQADAQADAAEYNAEVAEIEAASERSSAAAEAEDIRRSEGRKRSTALAQRGGSGVALTGTPLLIDADILGEIDLSSARIGHAGQLRATSLENQATLDRMQASNYRKAGSISAGASLLSGFGSFF